MRNLVFLMVLLLSQPAFAFSLFQPNVDAVKNLLDDPYSAKFEDVRTLPNGATCGTVNFKNQYGGYVGRKEFAIVDGVGYIEDQPSEEEPIILYCIAGAECGDRACVDGVAAERKLAPVIGNTRLEASRGCQSLLPDSPDGFMACNTAVVACRSKARLVEESACLEGVIQRHKKQ